MSQISSIESDWIPATPRRRALSLMEFYPNTESFTHLQPKSKRTSILLVLETIAIGIILGLIASYILYSYVKKQEPIVTTYIVQNSTKESELKECMQWIQVLSETLNDTLKELGREIYSLI